MLNERVNRAFGECDTVMECLTEAEEQIQVLQDSLPIHAYHPALHFQTGAVKMMKDISCLLTCIYFQLASGYDQVSDSTWYSFIESALPAVTPMMLHHQRTLEEMRLSDGLYDEEKVNVYRARYHVVMGMAPRRCDDQAMKKSAMAQFLREKTADLSTTSEIYAMEEEYHMFFNRLKDVWKTAGHDSLHPFRIPVQMYYDGCKCDALEKSMWIFQRNMPVLYDQYLPEARTYHKDYFCENDGVTAMEQNPGEVMGLRISQDSKDGTTVDALKDEDVERSRTGRICDHTWFSHEVREEIAREVHEDDELSKPAQALRNSVVW